MSTVTASDGLSFETRGGFFDQQVGEPCTFQVLEDMTTRCVPSGFASFFYTDDVCTALIAAFTSDCAVPPYVLEAVAVDACTSMFRVRSVGAEAAPAAVWTKNANGICQASFVFPAPWVYHAVSAPLAPSMFVEGTANVSP